MRAWYSHPSLGARGASAVEYALLASLVAAVIIGIVVVFGDNVSSLFTEVQDSRW